MKPVLQLWVLADEKEKLGAQVACGTEEEDIGFCRNHCFWKGRKTSDWITKGKKTNWLISLSFSSVLIHRARRLGRCVKVRIDLIAIYSILLWNHDIPIDTHCTHVPLKCHCRETDRHNTGDQSRIHDAVKRVGRFLHQVITGPKFITLPRGNIRLDNGLEV